MKLRTRIISTIMSMALALGVMGFAVWAAATQTLSVTNTVSFVSNHVLATVTGLVTGATNVANANYAGETTADDDDGVLGTWEIGEDIEFANENAPIYITITVVNNSLQRPLSFELTGFSYGAWNGVNLGDKNITRAVTYSITNAVPASGDYAGGQAQVEPEATATIVIQLDITDTGKSVTAFNNSFTMTLRNIGENTVYGPGDEPEEEPGEGNFVFNPALKTLTIPQNETLTYENMPQLNVVNEPAFFGFYPSDAYVAEDRISLPYTASSETVLYAKTDAKSEYYDFEYDAITDSLKVVTFSEVPSVSIEIPEMYYSKPVTVLWAFSDTLITDLYMPDSITQIAESLNNTPNLTNIRWSNNITSIMNSLTDNAWYEAELLATEDDAIILGSYLHKFVDADDSTTTYTIPNGVKTVAGHAFMDKSSLQTVTFPNSIERINSSAFYGAGITSVTLPSDEILLGSSVFSGTPWLTDIMNNEAIQGAFSIGNILYGYKGTLEAHEEAIIPSNTVSIAGGAFFELGFRAKIEIPSSVKMIGRYAFDSVGRPVLNTVDIQFDPLPAGSEDSEYYGGLLDSANYIFIAPGLEPTWRIFQPTAYVEPVFEVAEGSDGKVDGVYYDFFFNPHVLADFVDELTYDWDTGLWIEGPDGFDDIAGMEDVQTLTIIEEGYYNYEFGSFVSFTYPEDLFDEFYTDYTLNGYACYQTSNPM